MEEKKNKDGINFLELHLIHSCSTSEEIMNYTTKLRANQVTTQYIFQNNAVQILCFERT